MSNDANAIEQETPDYETHDEFALTPAEEAELLAQENPKATSDDEQLDENTLEDETADDEEEESEEGVGDKEADTPDDVATDVLVPDAELTVNNELVPAAVADHDKPAPDFESLVADVEAKIQEKETKAEALLQELEEMATKLDEGELGQGKYDVAKAKIERELRSIDSQINQFQSEKNNIGQQAQTYQSKAQDDFNTRWQGEVNNFLQQPENKIFTTNQQVSDLFDQTLQGMSEANLLAGLSMPQVLEAVRQQVGLRVQLPKAEAKSKEVVKPQTRKDPKIPPSTNQIPATESNGDDGGKFAYIDKLSGMAYEQALAKLAPDQLAEYERS